MNKIYESSTKMNYICVGVIFILTGALGSVRTESVLVFSYTWFSSSYTRVLKLPGCIQGPKVCLKFFFSCNL